MELERKHQRLLYGMLDLVACSSDDDAEENGAEHFTDKNDHRKLPVPSFQSSTVGSSSVFSNPFREEEYAQCSVLERHVKMTTPVSQQTQVQGKQICWNYRCCLGSCIIPYLRSRRCWFFPALFKGVVLTLYQSES